MQADRKSAVVLLELGFKYGPTINTSSKRSNLTSRISGLVGRFYGWSLFSDPFLDVHYHLTIDQESDDAAIRKRVEEFYRKDFPYIFVRAYNILDGKDKAVVAIAHRPGPAYPLKFY